jgi:hypothetical protein
MTTLTIEIAEKDKDFFLEVVKKFKGKVVTTSKKENLLLGIQQGLQEAMDIQKGNIRPLSLKDI